jgi:hypothetical protein
MPGSAAKLQITEHQQAVLRRIVAAPTSPVRLAQRADPESASSSSAALAPPSA